MKAAIHIITLAVSDLQRSLKFYKDGLGFPPRNYKDGDDHVAFDMEGDISLVLFARTEIAKLAGQTDVQPSSAEVVLSQVVKHKADVDTHLERAIAAGGTLMIKPEEQPWGYSGCFLDLDGHLWEVMWNPGFDVSG